jgi:DNA helicase TIP49 (TBP-interacting protein)
MKCIKSIKSSKEVQVGEIKRVDDKSAINMVGNYWMYISKSEWKLSVRKQKMNEQVTTQVMEQVDKKSYKKGQKSLEHKNKATRISK